MAAEEDNFLDGFALDKLDVVNYTSEEQLDLVDKFCTANLSEPYSVYTYRFFLNRWPKLAFIAYWKNELVGFIICRLTEKNSVLEVLHALHNVHTN